MGAACQRTITDVGNIDAALTFDNLNVNTVKYQLSSSESKEEELTEEFVDYDEGSDSFVILSVDDFDIAKSNKLTETSDSSEENDERMFMSFTLLPEAVELESEAGHPEAPTSRFKHCNPFVLLGSGQYGEVFKVLDLVTNKSCAQKVINKSRITTTRVRKQFESEISVLQRCKHANLIEMYETLETPKAFLITLELCELGSAREYFKDKIPLSEDHTRYLIGQLLMGVEYLHRQACIHRDIKLGNILMASPFHVKLIDFGLAKVFPKHVSDTPYDERDEILTNSIGCGTQFMKAPEQLNRSSYSFKVDCWAIGIVTWQFLIGGMPFLLRRREQIKRVVKGMKVPPRVSSSATNFIHQLLNPDVENRLAPCAALAHNFIFIPPPVTQLMKEYSYEFSEAHVKELDAVQPTPRQQLENITWKDDDARNRFVFNELE